MTTQYWNADWVVFVVEPVQGVRADDRGVRLVGWNKLTSDVFRWIHTDPENLAMNFDRYSFADASFGGDDCRKFVAVAREIHRLTDAKRIT